MGGVVDSIFGGGGDDAADAQIYAAQKAAEQFKPFNVSSDIGSVTVEGNALSAFLSPEFKSQMGAELALAGSDLDAATAERLALLNTFSEQDEADARRFKREELFRAGRTGTHGGVREMQSVEEAILRSQMQRQLTARELAFTERQNAISNAVTLGQLPTALGGLSINRTPATVAAGFLNAGNTAAAFDLARDNATRQMIFGAAQPYVTQGIGALGSTIGDIFGLGSAAAGTALAASAVPAGFGALTAAGAQSAGAAMTSSFLYSDRRLKTDIKPLASDGRYPWYRFRFKDPDTYGHGVYMGVMADEVEQINPAAVQTMSNGYKAVDYSKL